MDNITNLHLKNLDLMVAEIYKKPYSFCYQYILTFVFRL